MTACSARRGRTGFMAGQAVTRSSGASAGTCSGAGSGTDHLWGGSFAADGDRDVFLAGPGTGRDYVHDFEDGIDLIGIESPSGPLTWSAMKAAMTDDGWATRIDLATLGGSSNDALFVIGTRPEALALNDFVVSQTGTRADDRLRGGLGRDSLVGGGGHDVLSGLSGRDTLAGGSGHDRLGGSGGSDDLSGGSGRDWLFGGSGHDVLQGDSSRDRL